jgi:dCMP deaminase
MAGKKEARERPSWDEYFANITIATAKRSSCLKRHVGAVIIGKGKEILTTGYNGAPRGIECCFDKDTCWRNENEIPHGENKDLCIASHAEANAIYQAARNGVSLNGAVLYVTTFPCPTCAKAIIQTGLTKVYYLFGYYGRQYEFSKKLLREAKIKTQRVKIDLEKLARENPDLKLR